MNRRSGYRVSDNQTPSILPGSSVEYDLEEKVFRLQESLNTFRSEVDMKMKIMEQVLTSRSEQFALQKKLLDEEHSLYETVLTHWKDTANLAASGISIDFTEGFHPHHHTGVVDDEGENGINRSISIGSGKRSAAAARRARKKNFMSKRAKIDDGSEQAQAHSWMDMSNDFVDVDAFAETEMDSREDESEAESDDDYEPPKMGGKEKRVFVNYYTTDDISDGTRSNNPIWNCFLREENGRSALCKICDEQGVQRILKLKNSGTFCLHRHLKLMHDIVLETSQYKDRDEQQIRDLADVRVVSTTLPKENSSIRLGSFIRYNNYIYNRSATRNGTEYWRCRKHGCRGWLRKCNDLIEETAEHTCLTTPTDCDVVEIRNKLRLAALNKPDVPFQQLMDDLRKEYSEETFQKLPPDEALRRSVSRIRQRAELKNSGSV